ncbi:hypothetical protein [Branchiibius sp. NY16-3462-2]|uniref:hypothetical protein n=1 Tax=Branchiibius sp. NY16-3462-2 TaxID=1807500 RepID=UPI00079817DD|nr:hypothetical protein [Branchiibius sp. NY16-3462-2]KYH43675.1 hypothetical protein AZH51_02370 [Branchiibius sp. NY16-3462-2]
MTYRDLLRRIGDDTAANVTAIYDSYTEGDLDDDETASLIAGTIANANGSAVALADVSLAATLTLQLRRAVAPLGLLPAASDTERLYKAATTLLTSEDTTTERVARLGRSEPLEAAATAYSEGIAKSPEVTGWTRDVSPGACQICQDLAGTVLPDDVEMYHHTGCTCTPVPVTERNEQ